MEYSRLGTSGLKVSRICLGTMSYGSREWRPWVLQEEEGKEFIRHALENGINFFDTADMYSLGHSEEILGNAIRRYASRGDVVLATKAYFAMGKGPNDRGLSRKHLFDAVDASLRRLGTDYIDLYQIHRWDYETPIEETMRALDDIVRAGKARYIGASSMFLRQFCTAQFTARANGWTLFSSMQNHYNLVYREEEREMIPFCRDTGVGIIPWSPLARGFLSGSRSRERTNETPRAQTDEMASNYYFREDDFRIVDRVVETAKARGVSPAQIALAWILGREGVTAPIVGATKMNHLDEAIAAVSLKLTPEEAAYLGDAYTPHPILGHS